MVKQTTAVSTDELQLITNDNTALTNNVTDIKLGIPKEGASKATTGFKVNRDNARIGWAFDGGREPIKVVMSDKITGENGLPIMLKGDNIHIRKCYVRTITDEETGEYTYEQEMGKGIQLPVASPKTVKALRGIANALLGYATYIEESIR